MSLPPEAAICIPTYNQAPYLRLAVESALAQAGAHVEVWVGDDASTDDTPAVMAELCAGHPELHYRRAERNQGIAENSSWILSQPAAEFVVRLDSDDLLEPGYVATLLAWMRRTPQAGYAHTAVREMDAQGTPLTVKRVARPSGWQDAETALRASMKGYRTAANVLMFRAEALRAANYYCGRPEFVEDYDLSVRLAAAGWGNVYVDEPLACYRVWEDAGHRRARRKGLQLRGYTRIFEEALEPAFHARGWPMAPLQRARRKLAREHAAFCHREIFSAEEQRELRGLLRRLGEGPGLRLVLLAARCGLGGIIAAQQALAGWARNVVKGWLSTWRSRAEGGAR